ncbi:MAG: LCP family protein [Eubacteriales bacterium]|nr:LCP family protein [Eubacteriales bacterium]
MKRKIETWKIVLTLVGFVAALLAVFAVTQIIEAKSRQEVVVTREAYQSQGNQKSLRLYGTEYTYDHDFETYLFLGTDGSGNEEGEGEDYIGSMADFLGLLILDNTDQTYALLQLNRDTIAQMHVLDWKDEGEATAKQQLCMAHAYGGSKEKGCENTMDAVSQLLGHLPMDGYYALSMNDLPQLNHAIGGVTLTVQDDLTAADPALKKGATVTLTDRQVEIYARERYALGDGENLGRMERQKQLLTAFAERFREAGSQNAGFALQVFHELEQLATSDINGKTFSSLTKKLSNYTDRGIYSFAGTTELVESAVDGIEHMRFYPEETSVIDIMTELFGLGSNEENKGEKK